MMNLATIRHEWALQLDQEFNPQELHRLRDLYVEGQRNEKAYMALYDRERAAFLVDLNAYRAKLDASVAGLNKAELIAKHYNLLGMMQSKRTRTELIDVIWTIRAGDVENEHSRVQRIWKSMTEAQRRGDEPPPPDPLAVKETA